MMLIVINNSNVSHRDKNDEGGNDADGDINGEGGDNAYGGAKGGGRDYGDDEDDSDFEDDDGVKSEFLQFNFVSIWLQFLM